MTPIRRARELLEDPFAIFQQLTEQEREALKWASRGYSYKEVADIMKITPEMANYFIRNGCLKINKSKRELPTWVFDQLLMIIK